MKKTILRISKLVALFAISFGVVTFAKDNFAHLFNNRVDAAGAFTFNMGVAQGDPIFTFGNIAPGFEETKSITANNGDSVVRTAGVKGIKTMGGILDEAMMIEISQNGNTLYGPVTLSKFFSDSQSINGIELSSIHQGQSVEYDFNVMFDTQAGNEYQNQSITFDLQFGIVTSSDIPAACEGMKFARTIYGTAGNDRINGGAGNTLIIAFEGNNVINGGSGNDCIIAGDGNNTISSGAGNDIIVVGNGANTLNGGAGNDTITAGNGGNKIDGGAGSDTITSGDGNDILKGGAGNDSMYGNGGNDSIDGGAGNDRLYGGAGDDTIVGGAGSDYLDGGIGNNTIDGQAGRDTCLNGTKKSCEL